MFIIIQRLKNQFSCYVASRVYYKCIALIHVILNLPYKSIHQLSLSVIMQLCWNILIPVLIVSFLASSDCKKVKKKAKKVKKPTERPEWAKKKQVEDYG